ncbi:MAG: MATE family efflux transporter, partial [Lachnospiraceae bacterium]|nr:MATE family efflux transporter [Lachnospiraceae bacterium]
GRICSILYIGVRNSLENSLFQLGKILTLSMVATYDTYVVAVNTVCNTLALSNILGTWLQIGLMGVWIARSID